MKLQLKLSFYFIIPALILGSCNSDKNHPSPEIPLVEKRVLKEFYNSLEVRYNYSNDTLKEKVYLSTTSLGELQRHTYSYNHKDTIGVELIITEQVFLRDPFSNRLASESYYYVKDRKLQLFDYFVFGENGQIYPQFKINYNYENGSLISFTKKDFTGSKESEYINVYNYSNNKLDNEVLSFRIGFSSAKPVERVRYSYRSSQLDSAFFEYFDPFENKYYLQEKVKFYYSNNNVSKAVILNPSFPNWRASDSLTYFYNEGYVEDFQGLYGFTKKYEFEYGQNIFPFLFQRPDEIRYQLPYYL